MSSSRTTSRKPATPWQQVRLVLTAAPCARVLVCANGVGLVEPCQTSPASYIPMSTKHCVLANVVYMCGVHMVCKQETPNKHGHSRCTVLANPKQNVWPKGERCEPLKILRRINWTTMLCIFKTLKDIV